MFVETWNKIIEKKFVRSGGDYKYKLDIVWGNVLVLGYLHAAAVYGGFLWLAGYTKLGTSFWMLFLSVFSTLGVTGGAHRLWAHRSYKANLPLRILLATLMTLTFQNHIYEWVRDHRVHHKHAETDADPHNAKRGFFFAHVGWLMVKKHPAVSEQGRKIDLSDLEADGVVMFQKKYYVVLVILGTFIMPTFVPWYFWQEDIWLAWYTASIFRYILTVNLVWCINSAAHLYGTKPYDRNIGPVESPAMIIFGCGEGFHNYHHTFPWDYKAAELGNDIRNITTSFIDLFAKIGWATDLKTVSGDMLRKRILRTGDGTYPRLQICKNVNGEQINEDVIGHEIIWGWGDKAMRKDEREFVQIYNKSENFY